MKRILTAILAATMSAGAAEVNYEVLKQQYYLIREYMVIRMPTNIVNEISNAHYHPNFMQVDIGFHVPATAPITLTSDVVKAGQITLTNFVTITNIYTQIGSNQYAAMFTCPTKAGAYRMTQDQFDALPGQAQTNMVVFVISK